MKKITLKVSVAVVILLFAIVACAAPPPASTPAPAPKPTATAAPAPTTVAKPTATTPAPTTSAPASQKPITFKGASYKLAANNFEARMGVEFINEIAKRSNGLLTFKLLGGTEVVPSLEQPEAVRKGIVDFIWTPASYGAGIVPEANTHTILRMDSKEERSRGIYDLLNQTYQKQGMYYMSNFDPSNWDQNFYFLLTKPITKSEEMKGMKMRSQPSFQPIVEAVGAVPIGMPVEDTYTAIERGLIVGGPQNPMSTMDYSLFEVAKYYVLPGFGHSQIIFYLNLNVWNSVPANLQKLMKDTLMELEPKYASLFISDYKAALAKLETKGIKLITLAGEDGEKTVSAFYDGNWKTIIAKSPTVGAKLRELAGLKPLAK